MNTSIKRLYTLIAKFKVFDFIPSVLLRAYLVPVFLVAGINKYNTFDSTVTWFGDSLGLPFPYLNALLATGAEIGCSVLLIFGLATRFACIPLFITMIVAALTVHLQNGWQVIHGKLSAFPVENIDEVVSRLSTAKSILKEHGDYPSLTEFGNIVMLNNGVEFIAAYGIMLIALMFLGGGRYFSIDYYLKKIFIGRN